MGSTIKKMWIFRNDVRMMGLSINKYGYIDIYIYYICICLWKMEIMFVGAEGFNLPEYRGYTTQK